MEVVRTSAGLIEEPPRWTRKELREFDRLSALTRDFLVARYGDADADALIREARRQYEDILPQVAWVKGRRAPLLNWFLRTTAQEVAVYKAVEARGGTGQDAWEICEVGLRSATAQVPTWKRWLMKKLMFSRLVRWEVRRRERNEELVRDGDFETRSVTGDGEAFDFGADYVRCGNLELANKLGAAAFAPYICMSDIAFSDAFGWGLIRTQSLADGCSHCDFRFKAGGPTRITSKTPEVQQTIERIARKRLGESPSCGRAAHDEGA